MGAIFDSNQAGCSHWATADQEDSVSNIFDGYNTNSPIADNIQQNFTNVAETPSHSTDEDIMSAIKEFVQEQRCQFLRDREEPPFDNTDIDTSTEHPIIQEEDTRALHVLNV
jgi:hypothetical protein